MKRAIGITLFFAAIIGIGIWLEYDKHRQQVEDSTCTPEKAAHRLGGCAVVYTRPE